MLAISRDPELVCPWCGREDALSFPWGFRWRKSRVTCRACGGFSGPVHVHWWSLPVLVGVNGIGAFVFTTLAPALPVHFALNLGLVVLTLLVDGLLPFRLVRAKGSPYPEAADDADAWTCSECGTDGPDFLGACWNCEAERPAA